MQNKFRLNSSYLVWILRSIALSVGCVMDFNFLKSLCPKIDPILLVPFGVVFAMALLCYCYHCHQCVRDRRRARTEKRELPQPLNRLSISPGCPIIASTKLTHCNNRSEVY